jgi:hypothetical protein
MIKITTTLLLFCFLTGMVGSQTTALFDDTRLSSVYIVIPPDSLALIYDSVLSDHYYLARFVFDDNETRDTLENVGFRLRGNTSRFSEKKSFKISFNTYVPGRRYQGVKKINLNGAHNDPTLIREKLFYDLWKNAGMVERRTAFAKVFINGNYYGLYTNLEEMDKDWLKRVYPGNDGNLFKCTYPADLVYHGPNQQTYKDLENSTVTGGRVYDLQTNETEDDYARLVELITLLDRQPAGSFASDISSVLNVDHFLKALALDVATGNWDDYGYNKNNYYLYENPEDSRFDFITYDADNTFGVDWFGIDWGTRNCLNWINTKIKLPMAQKLLAVPEFKEQYKRYLDTIATNIIHPDSVFPYLDNLKALIREAAVEDTYRTLDYGYTIADFDNAFTQPIDDHTPYGLKPFFTTRRQAILNQLHPAGIAGNENAVGRIILFPNPASGEVTISLADHPKHPVTGWISDISGRIIDDFSLDPGDEKLSVTEFEPGIYVVHINADKWTGQTKLIIR